MDSSHEICSSRESAFYTQIQCHPHIYSEVFPFINFLSCYVTSVSPQIFPFSFHAYKEDLVPPNESVPPNAEKLHWLIKEAWVPSHLNFGWHSIPCVPTISVPADLWSTHCLYFTSFNALLIVALVCLSVSPFCSYPDQYRLLIALTVFMMIKLFFQQ